MINCSKCKFYNITWDQHNRYGCSKFGFKTNIKPSDYIKKISGENCYSFIPKKSEF